MKPERLNAFTDGVIAIIITIMVLTLAGVAYIGLECALLAADPDSPLHHAVHNPVKEGQRGA